MPAMVIFDEEGQMSEGQMSGDGGNIQRCYRSSATTAAKCRSTVGGHVDLIGAGTPLGPPVIIDSRPAAVTILSTKSHGLSAAAARRRP